MVPRTLPCEAIDMVSVASVSMLAPVVNGLHLSFQMFNKLIMISNYVNVEAATGKVANTSF